MLFSLGAAHQFTNGHASVTVVLASFRFVVDGFESVIRCFGFFGLVNKKIVLQNNIFWKLKITMKEPLMRARRVMKATFISNKVNGCLRVQEVWGQRCPLVLKRYVAPAPSFKEQIRIYIFSLKSKLLFRCSWKQNFWSQISWVSYRWFHVHLLWKCGFNA